MFNGPFSRTTWVGRYQKGKTNLDFTEARDSEWQWHQLGICKSAPHSRQNNYASTSQLSFLQAGCPSCRPTNSVKALKAQCYRLSFILISCKNCSTLKVVESQVYLYKVFIYSLLLNWLMSQSDVRLFLLHVTVP